MYAALEVIGQHGRMKGEKCDLRLVPGDLTELLLHVQRVLGE